MNQPSAWPLRYRILAVVLYAAAMGAIGWLLHRLLPLMPDSWDIPYLILLFAGLGALAVYGYLRDRRRRPPRQ